MKTTHQLFLDWEKRTDYSRPYLVTYSDLSGCIEVDGDEVFTFTNEEELRTFLETNHVQEENILELFGEWIKRANPLNSPSLLIFSDYSGKIIMNPFSRHSKWVYLCEFGSEHELIKFLKT